MRGRDDETGEFLAPSRSANRREALDTLALGEALVALSEAQLARLPIPDELLPHIRDTQRIPSHGARKRQMAFLAKHMRRQDQDVLDAIRDGMSKDGDASRRETALLHRVEVMRDELLGDDGDAAMTRLLTEYPLADRQHLRQLTRNTLDERRRSKPPHAFRELFRELRELLAQDDGASSDDADVGFGDHDDSEQEDQD